MIPPSQRASGERPGMAGIRFEEEDVTRRHFVKLVAAAVAAGVDFEQMAGVERAEHEDDGEDHL